MIKLGAHVSITGGYSQALTRIHKMGGNCLQVFSSSPRGWNFAKVDETLISDFKKTKERLNINPVYFHASYLVNLADNGKIGHLSKLSLIAEMNVASQLGTKGSIIHLGSFKTGRDMPWHVSTLNNPKYQTLIIHIKEILEKTPENTFFIIENAGNKKIGQSLDEIAKIVKDVDNNRVKICLDSCHLFSAGYDLRTEEKLDAFLQEFDTKIGLNRLEVWHLNDSRDPYNSFHDRHENIGQGTIGIDEFRLILNHAKLKHLPFIIEVPGFDDNGPDKKNLDILKSLI